MTAVNVFVNVFDRITRGDETDEFNTNPETWWANVKAGFEWDDNNFNTNQFAHPYHGSTYFNAGRSNGLDFWESGQLAALGSLQWEYMGETNRPAFNDFINTTVGGIALGEMFRRVAILIRDNEATGKGRVWREIGAAPLDVVGGFNRVVRGEAWRVAPNPPDRRPNTLGLRIDAGVRLFDEGSGPDDETTTTAFGELRFDYGDMLDPAARQPYDAFRFIVQANTSDSAVVNRFQGEGLLWGAPLDPSGKANHRFVINQRFDYVTNPAYQVGGQSVEGRLISRFGISDDLGLRTTVGVIATLLGAVNSEFVGLTQRTYDYGPGGGLDFGAVLRRRGEDLVSLGWVGWWVETVAGDDGSHFVEAALLDARWPIGRTFGLGASASYFRRDSWYPGDVAVHQDTGELRFFGTWRLF
jgi:hypothetical protein